MENATNSLAFAAGMRELGKRREMRFSVDDNCIGYRVLEASKYILSPISRLMASLKSLSWLQASNPQGNSRPYLYLKRRKTAISSLYYSTQKSPSEIISGKCYI